MRSSCLLLVLLALACDSSDYVPRDAATDVGDATSDADESDAGDPRRFMPALTELPAGEWTELRPGAPTICSRGTEYAFYVYPGTTDDLVVNFIGGGACWNATTCSFAEALFQEDIENVRAAVEGNQHAGITSMEREDNPVHGYTHVVIPYCTGDVHWGNKETTYGEGEEAVTINHRGAVNARAVLDWVYDNVESPNHVLTTGCSAGGYGSALWSAYLMNHYPDARNVQFSDSAAGVITDTFFMESFPSWNALEAFPDFVDGLDPSEIEALAEVYIPFAAQFPDATFSQYNTVFDDNQTLYYRAMGGQGGAEGWSEKMLMSLERIHEDADNFRTYTAAGERHCIIVFDEFYSLETNGVKLTDWLSGMLEGDDVADVTCGEDCGEPGSTN